MYILVIMRRFRRDNFPAIDEMRRLLSETKRLTMENFVMKDEPSYDDEPSYGDEEVLMRDRGEEMPSQGQEISGIEKELTQIRKIALSVINRLADQPTSPQYDTMKKIWNMVDKAIEQPQKGENYKD